MSRRRALLTGRKKEWAVIPILSSHRFTISVSLWNSGRMIVNWGNGDINTWFPSLLRDGTKSQITGIYRNYSPDYDGDILFSPTGGLKNVYSLEFFNSTVQGKANRLNIDDFGEFISQFPNLYSLRINIYNYQNNNYRGMVSGSLEDIPNSVKRYGLRTFDVLSPKATLNINNFSPTSQLEWIDIDDITGTTGVISRSGDLKNLPPNINYFKDRQRGTTGYSYTSGRIWRSEFDTLNLRYGLTDAENDSILIDLANSVTSAIGDKVIRLKGARTSVSDSAVLYLEGLGFTVTLDP